MFKWIKKGLIFDVNKMPKEVWFEQFAQAPSTLIFDEFVRVYFSCRPLPDKNGSYVSYSAFVDLDRKDLTHIVNIAKQPILELGQKGAFDEFGTYPVSVIKKEKDILAYYGGWTRCESVPFNVAIGAAVSKNNGLTFKKMGQGPVLSYSANEPFIISGPKIRHFNDEYYLFYIAGKKWLHNEGKPEPVYKIRMARSKNGVDWIKHNEDLIVSKIGEDEAQASPDVFYYNKKYHMFFCYRAGLNYRGKDGGYRIGYASSVDLKNWERNDANAGLDISEQGWDSEMISYPHVFELDGNIYMLYLGNDVGKQGFGLAKLEGTLK